MIILYLQTTKRINSQSTIPIKSHLVYRVWNTQTPVTSILGWLEPNPHDILGGNWTYIIQTSTGYDYCPHGPLHNKLMSNTFLTITIINQQVHTSTNLWPNWGLAQETIQHLYQCTHEGSRGRWTASVDALRKWIKEWNTDPDTEIILVDVLL